MRSSRRIRCRRRASKEILDCDAPLIAKEIPFLQRVVPRDASIEAGLPEPAEPQPEANADESQTAAETAHEDVGRIDLVCVHPLQETEWCAVELQAVYFSGGAMSRDFQVIREHSGNRVPLPGANRRPDFRSSGPKRL